MVECYHFMGKVSTGLTNQANSAFRPAGIGK